ncbi:src-like-adapter 2 isoform X1 [Sphaerodactylus townsendi]|uniref:src-like-adapter 2 isoform X1 n=1 Tax=Sphaerodactylus townsendi TaxID=933632 RepID=UPI002027678A|nr:src-like-adapter 2 isoform X1 [Sphaerodactylus townsendi]
MIMGSLFSRRKPVPQNHQPTGCGPRHTAIAICNFPPGPAEQILQMGEQLHLLSQNGEWWKVTSVATGRDCYIPSSHIAKITYRWLYDGISREKAEELLMMPSNRDGSFLIRKSQMRKGCYALSVRHAQHGGWDSVKHYRINCLENNWIYITCHLTFPHLQDLVDYYSDSQDGLCCRLQEPCFIQGSDSGLLPSLSKPVTVKQSNLNWQEINSSELLSENLLPEDSPISLGLRDAINSYVLVTEDLPLETRSTRKGKKCKDI